MDARLREHIDAIRVIDTHEHIVEEETRLAEPSPTSPTPCKDFALLFTDYSQSELVVSGMSAEDIERYRSPETDIMEKWRLIGPYYERCRNTGYLRAIELSVKKLYGIDELNEKTIPLLNERFVETIRPGYYYTVLRDHCGIECCMIDAVDLPVVPSAYPDLLRHDVGCLMLTGPDQLEAIAANTGLPAKSLDDWLRIIDWYFDRYGPTATAIKNQLAYRRRLDFGPPQEDLAGPIFDRLAKGEKVPDSERKPLQDYLMDYCVRQALKHDLAIKLHTGYYAGYGYMPMERVMHNAADLLYLLTTYPEARFVLMHMGYPFQESMLALAKHFPNVYVDLCWAWIISPPATERLVYEFLQTAPATKLLGFGGDYVPVENVYGHVHLARRGMTRALSRLVEDGWVDREGACRLATMALRENAFEVFRLGRTQKA
jgi:hypothetical protein